MVPYLAPSWSCTSRAVAVLPLCFSAPLVHLIFRLTGRLLHSRCTLYFASMRICRNCTRTVHLGSAVALHCAARTAGAFSSLIILTVSRPVAIKFLMVLTVGVVTSPRISLVSCASSCTRQGFSLGLIPERKKWFALYLKWSSFVPISRCLCSLRTGIPFRRSRLRQFTGRSLMVANDGHHTRRRTFHAVSFGAFAVG